MPVAVMIKVVWVVVITTPANAYNYLRLCTYKCECHY
jgi:hypothetical protein